MKSVLKKIGHHLSDISNDSRNIKKDSLFLAYPGIHDDGRAYIEAAIKKEPKQFFMKRKILFGKKHGVQTIML